MPNRKRTGQGAIDLEGYAILANHARGSSEFVISGPLRICLSVVRILMNSGNFDFELFTDKGNVLNHEDIVHLARKASIT